MVVSGGVTLHVHHHAAGRTPAATAIVLHGGGGHGRMLSPVGVAVQQLGGEAFAPDLPGYGYTVTPDPRAVRYEDWVRAVADLVEGLARTDRPLLLVGASMGGRLALDVAHRVGHGIVDAVVATCLLDPRRTEAAAAVARHHLLVRWGRPALRLTRRVADPIRVPIRWLVPIEAIANDPDLVRTCASDPLGAGVSVPLGFLRSWFDYDPGYDPESFSACPVVLAHPGEDRWTPIELSRSILAKMPVETKLVVLEGCGHFPVEPGAAKGFSVALQHALDHAARQSTT